MLTDLISSSPQTYKIDIGLFYWSSYTDSPYHSLLIHLLKLPLCSYEKENRVRTVEHIANAIHSAAMRTRSSAAATTHRRSQVRS